MKEKSKKYVGVRSRELSNGDVAYYVRWVNREGEKKEMKVGTKNQGWSERKAYLKRIELQNTQEEKQIKEIRFDEVVKRFLEIRKLHLKPKSFKDYEGKVKPLIAAFGTQNIHEISNQDINSLMIELGTKYANKTINSIIGILKAILNLAQEEFGIKNEVLKNHKNLKVNNTRERFLDREEIEKLKEALLPYPELLLFVLISLNTGARLMGVLSISKQDVDLQNRSVMISDYKNSSKYQGFLSSEVCELLAKKWDKLDKGDKLIQRSKRLITEELGAILNHLFNEGITDSKQKVVIHSLRHTFASHLAISGTPLQIIQKLLNHKDIKMTMRYAHLLPDIGRDYALGVWDHS